MKCSECNREIAADAAFCPYCGERLKSNRSVETAFGGGQSPSSTVAKSLKPGVQRDSGKQPPEVDLWNDSYSPKALFGPFVAIDLVVILSAIGIAVGWPTGMGWLLFGIGCVILYGGLGLTLAYQRLSLRYRLTTYRFFHERGLLSRVTDRIEVIDIDDVTIHQGLIERILGVGTILIQSSDRTHSELRLPGIDNVKKVADLIDNTRRAERQRRGIHIESI